MATWARREFGKDKIFVLGRSYGHFLGLKFAQRRPEWLYPISVFANPSTDLRMRTGVAASRACRTSSRQFSGSSGTGLSRSLRSTWSSRSDKGSVGPMQMGRLFSEVYWPTGRAIELRVISPSCRPINRFGG